MRDRVPTSLTCCIKLIKGTQTQISVACKRQLKQKPTVEFAEKILKSESVFCFFQQKAQDENTTHVTHPHVALTFLSVGAQSSEASF